MPFTPPTIVGSVTSTYTTSTTPKTNASPAAAQVGDRYAIVGITENDNVLISTPTDSPLSDTFTLAQSLTGTGGQFCGTYCWAMTAGTAGSLTISAGRTGSSGQFGISTVQFRNSDGFGASQKTSGSGVATIGINTTQDHSAIVVVIGDWNTTAGPRTWLTLNGFTPTATGGEVEYQLGSSGYYVAYYPDAGTAGLKTVGLQNPSSGMKYTIIALEVLSLSTSATGDGGATGATGGGATGTGSDGATGTGAAFGLPNLTAGVALTDILLSGRSFDRQMFAYAINNGVSTQLQLVNNNLAVAYSLGQQVGRSAAFTSLRRYVDDGVLDPLTSLIFIRTRVAGFEVPLFTGRILQLTDTEKGDVNVVCNDFSDDVVKNDFSIPWASDPSSTVGPEIARIIRDSNLGFLVDTSQAPQVQVPALLWDVNRGQAIEDLAQGANCLWRSDRVGGFTIYPNPYTFTPSTPASIVLRDGVGGTLIKVQHTLSRAKIYNQITVVVDRTDPNSQPFRVSARDANPNSPTYWGGPFGQRNRTIKLQTPVSLSLAQQLAIRLLQQSLALQETWQVSTPFMPLVDQGDIVGLYYRGTVHNAVAESVTINGATNGATNITCRRLQLEDPSLIALLGG